MILSKITATEDYQFDRFLKYDELVSWVQAKVVSFPKLVAVESYGKSYEGRDLLLVTLTDTDFGIHSDKPAHWVDGKAEVALM